MTIERDAFGIPVPSEETDDEFAFLKDTAPEEPTEPATDDATEAPVEAPTGSPAPPEPEQVAAAEGQTAEEVIDPAAPRLYAKRYETVENLEDGYQELRELHRRTAERAKEYEEQNRVLMGHAAEVESTLQRAVQALQQQQQVQPQQFDDYGNPVAPPAPTPQQVQQYVDQQVQMRLQQAQSGWQEQAAADAQAEAARRAIYGFFEKHPEVEVNSPVDDDIAQTIHAINDSWQTWGTSMDITDPDTIEVAYEATQRPALRHVLEKNPALVDDEQGMQLARFQASILEGQPITQSAQNVPASSPGAQVVGSSRPPVIERGATTSNTSDDRPLDEVDQAFLEYRQHKQRSGDSVFFGAPGRFE